MSKGSFLAQAGATQERTSQSRYTVSYPPPPNTTAEHREEWIVDVPQQPAPAAAPPPIPPLCWCTTYGWGCCDPYPIGCWP